MFPFKVTVRTLLVTPSLHFLNGFFATTAVNGTGLPVKYLPVNGK